MMWLLLLIPVVVYAIGFVATLYHQLVWWWTRVSLRNGWRIANYMALRWPWSMWRWYRLGWSYKESILNKVCPLN